MIAQTLDAAGVVQQAGSAVLHDINMASRSCDELMALHSGRLLAHGSPHELMRDSTLEAIYGLPMQVIRHPNGEHNIAVAQ